MGAHPEAYPHESQQHWFLRRTGHVVENHSTVHVCTIINIYFTNWSSSSEATATATGINGVIKK